MECPPTEVTELLKKGAKDWQRVNPIQKDICECALEKIRRKVAKRRILVKPAFRDYDKFEMNYFECIRINELFC